MTHPLFYSIDDSQFGRTARKKMHDLRDHLQSFYGLRSDISFAETLLEVAYEEDIWCTLAEKISVNHTLISALCYEKQQGFAVKGLMHFISHSKIDRNMIVNGISDSYKAIDIKDEEIRNQCFRALIHEAYSANRRASDSVKGGGWVRGWDEMIESQGYHERTTDVGLLIMADMSKNVIKDCEIDPWIASFSDMAKPQFLIDPISNKVEQVRSLFYSLSDASDILFAYLAPLCQAGYLSGLSARTVIQSVEPFLRSLANWAEISDQDGQRDVFVRRGLVHIAMGFEGLMSEIELRIDDLMPMKSGDYPSWYGFDKLMASPLDCANLNDGGATLSRNRDLLAKNGLDVGIDTLMEIESRRLSDDPGPLAWYIRDLADYSEVELHKALSELVAHKYWPSLETVWVIDRLSPPTQFSDEFHIEMLKKIDNGDQVLPSIDYELFPLETRQDIGQKMIKDGIMTPSLMQQLALDPSALRGYVGTISKELKRVLIKAELGL